MKTETITIIGLEKIGASVGLAIKKSPLKVTIVGHDAESYRSREAKEELNAIDKIEWNLVNAAAAGDIVVLALPASQLQAALQAIGDDLKPHALVLDMSPSKGQGAVWAETYLRQGHYVGAVPVLSANRMMDGRDSLFSASAELFADSQLALMPGPRVDEQAVETAVKFGKLLGADPFFLQADEYDRLMQGVDTLPALVAAALYQAVSQTAGWKDMQRLAGSSFAMMTQPLQQGGEAAFLAYHQRETAVHWLNAVIKELETVRQLLQTNELDIISAHFEQLESAYQKWLGQRIENNWIEIEPTSYEGTSIGEQLFGRWGKRDDKKQDD